MKTAEEKANKYAEKSIEDIPLDKEQQPLVSGRSEQLPCDHLWKSRFNAKRGSYVICSKCSEER